MSIRIMKNASLLYLFLFLYLPSVNAVNLGVHGQIYSIAEVDFLDLITDRYQTMKANGEWRVAQENWRKKMEQFADRPRSLNLATTTTKRAFYFDPTIELKRDIIDVVGNVLIKAGTTVNPLEAMPLRNVLLFINGDDNEQIKWAKGMDLQYPLTKWILVNGSITKTVKKASKPIYFDQWGKLTKNFNIQHVPAKVMQEGSRLKIEECVP